MAISRLLYAQQTCLISCGGYLKSDGNATPTYSWQENDSDPAKVKNANGKDTTNKTSGFGETRNWLLPVQSFSADETIPNEDVLVMGNKGGVARVQKDVASGKCTVKAYLAEYMSFLDGSTTRDAGVYQWLQHAASGTGTENNAGNRALAGYVDAGGNTAYADVETSGTAPDTPSAGNYTDLQQVDPSTGPYPGITSKGYLAGEAWIENGYDSVAKQGLLEQLIWESIGGFESLVQIFQPSSTNAAGMDGVSFIGILSSISIDASKGAYPTIDLSWEGLGEMAFINLGSTDLDSDGAGADTAKELTHSQNAGDLYVKSCRPHVSSDVLVWGRDQWTGTATGFANDKLALLAGNAYNYYSEEDIIDETTAYGGLLAAGSETGRAKDNRYGDAMDTGSAHQSAGLNQGEVDVMNSAKMSFELPTETLSGLGQVIEGNTFTVRDGNRVFSKPPYKSSLNLDGQGLRAAGIETYSGGVVSSRVLPNEIQIGQLHCVIDPAGAATASRSFSQNVGDVGATYSVTVEGTDASFYATYQGVQAPTVLADRDVAS